ncbi:MAG: class I SAM-dependent methyltransferase family protein [Promethearchaeota archaeon]
MSFDRPFVRTKECDGEKARQALIDAKLLDTECKIAKDQDWLYFPLTQKKTEKGLKKILGRIKYEVGRRQFTPVFMGPKTLSEALVGLIPSELLELLPRAYDLIGDIAVIEIPDELTDYDTQIGAALKTVHKNFNTVLGKKGAISGITRVREYEVLAGQNKTKTIHTEYNLRIAVDIAKAYFSPRLLEEHNRIADLVTDGELVIDMFTGVGPFALHIARRHRVKVYAVDINPDAIDLLQESLELNRFAGEVIPILGDTHEYIQSGFDGDVDRVIMNHPSGAFEFVVDACKALKSEGIMHYYEFMGGDDPEGSLTDRITNLVSEAGREAARIDTIRRVRDSAPYEYQMVADVVIQ